jgi:hypothetical protein
MPVGGNAFNPIVHKDLDRFGSFDAHPARRSNRSASGKRRLSFEREYARTMLATASVRRPRDGDRVDCDAGPCRECSSELHETPRSAEVARPLVRVEA